MLDFCTLSPLDAALLPLMIQPMQPMIVANIM
jgi:hypothetical protein